MKNWAIKDDFLFPMNENSWAESLKSIATAPEVEHGAAGTCAQQVPVEILPM